jgi:hypothetical protein
MSSDEVRQARETAISRYAFRLHLGVYLLVNAFLFGVWLVTGAGFPWFFFPAGAWGVGLLAHYHNAYGAGGRNWIDNETRRILAAREGGTGY